MVDLWRWRDAEVVPWWGWYLVDLMAPMLLDDPVWLALMFC